MDLETKLALLTQAAIWEPAEETDPSGRARTRLMECIYEARAHGRPVRLLKVLLTSACERDCYYCPFRAGRSFRRATFQPDELARVFYGMHQRGLVDGLFLSSGILGGGVRTQDRLLAVAGLLRQRYGYRGYLHLKLMPGAEPDQVREAMRWADRVSINLEAPNPERLSRLAPHKAFMAELEGPLRTAGRIRREEPSAIAWSGRWPSLTTQLVVGAAGESDREIMETTARLHREIGLARVYYSPFHPVPDTPLEDLPPTLPLRARRLYQAEWLLRVYGFRFEELPFDETGNLPLAEDPKQAWARRALADRPVEINRASYEELVRVPGIGPKTARAILQARREGRLTRLEGLEALGVSVARAAPFITLNGRRLPQTLPLPLG
ncbi:helix-hairpin-helix domain-containing protein [Thermoflexus sp.]|uniref:helix-hairpin-helix domain-containing protein n=1 Tax=Thermoflexus sp. TaxID=1969742 RepID=UPI002ADDF81B|nr:helix-hairpin-helix domain-containing protein [Thermoflexus sp.]